MTKENTPSQFFLIRQDMIPEAVMKTLEAKQLLLQGEVKTIQEAVEKVGLSRSAFYKYKDGIFPPNQLEHERIVTISMDLLHLSGILSKVLALVAGFEGNVLTINQTIPLQGVANVVITVETSKMGESLPQLMESLQRADGVSRAGIIGQG